MHKPIITSIILTLLTLLLATPAPAHETTLSGYKICLDPGHGGDDPGAIYDDGIIYLEEADINLDVSYGLKTLLETSGAIVVMTRTDDSSKDNSDRYIFCNNESATILVSLHTNSVTDPAWDGSMALYFHPDEDDKILAQTIYDVMYPALKISAPDPDNFTPFGLDWFASGVLLKSDMPGAMMEPLFMSHHGEANQLITPIFTDFGSTPNFTCDNCRRAQISLAIHDGIVAYFSSPVPGSVMHIEYIELSLERRGPLTFAEAAVRIVDIDGNPVSGATVTGEWTGVVTGIAATATDENGIAIAPSPRTRASTGKFRFTVTGVSKDSWAYSQGSNVETEDTISFQY